MERMRKITQGATEWDKKTTTQGQFIKAKDNSSRNCGKPGHSHKDCRGEPSCFYCKEKGHRRFDCPVLKKKESKPAIKATTSSGATTASVVPESQPSDTVAVVQAGCNRLVVDDPLVKVSNLQDREINLLALIDTGSPVSFVKNRVYKKFIEPFNKMRAVNSNLRNLSSQPLDILGLVEVKLVLQNLADKIFFVDLYILNSDAFQGDLILGREFLTKEKLTLIYEPSAQ